MTHFKRIALIREIIASFEKPADKLEKIRKALYEDDSGGWATASSDPPPIPPNTEG